MREKATIGVLAYLIVATFGEVYAVTAFTPGWFYYGVLGAIAISEATLMGASYMNLRKEPFAVKAIATVGLFFIFVLIISMLFVYV